MLKQLYNVHVLILESERQNVEDAIVLTTPTRPLNSPLDSFNLTTAFFAEISS